MLWLNSTGPQNGVATHADMAIGAHYRPFDGGLIPDRPLTRPVAGKTVRGPAPPPHHHEEITATRQLQRSRRPT
jgi:hypothetical protein